jgi:hypothetical protein
LLAATHSWVLASPSRTTNRFPPPWPATSVTHTTVVAPLKWTQTHHWPTLASEVHMLPYFDSMLLIWYLWMWIVDYLSWKWDSKFPLLCSYFRFLTFHSLLSKLEWTDSNWRALGGRNYQPTFSYSYCYNVVRVSPQWITLCPSIIVPLR